ncbi:MAG TPA: hypothetical protein VHE55_06250 [Fimbriimonadaceae bacterium]|nr:hypothetical protein [Fimbriimonadaceae bacterium]
MSAAKRVQESQKWLARYESRSELGHVMRSFVEALRVALVLKLFFLSLHIQNAPWLSWILMWAFLEYAQGKLKRFWLVRRHGLRAQAV